jgi:16S rRNA (guanine1207-N2)-methyltransferase
MVSPLPQKAAGFRSGAVRLAAKAVADLAGARLLAMLPPEPGLPGILGPVFPQATYLHRDFAVYRKDRDAFPNEDARFSVEPEKGGYEAALVFHPGSRELLKDLLAIAARATSEGAPVWVVGENRSGIRSARPAIEDALGPVSERRSGQHAVALLAARVRETPPRAEARRFEVEAGGRMLRVVSLPGVFSHGELDEGTALLLEVLPRAIAEESVAKTLDWGTGCGVLGASIKALSPRTDVDLVDADVLSLESAKRTLEENGLAGKVFPVDGFRGVDETYDLIVANPPFHAGRRTDLRAAREFLEAAVDHLRLPGRLLVVTNAFIDHRGAMGRFDRVRALVENPRYRVIEARSEGRPPRPSGIMGERRRSPR